MNGITLVDSYQISGSNLPNDSHSAERVGTILGLLALFAVIAGLVYLAHRHNKKVEAEKQAKAVRQNELAASRDPRPDVQRKANECRHCKGMAVKQQPRYIFDPPATWWDRLRGVQPQTFVQTEFDSSHPAVLCSNCQGLTAASMISALVVRQANESALHATLVGELTQAQEADIPTAVHGAMAGIRQVQDSFSKRGEPPRPTPSKAPTAPAPPTDSAPTT
jgi:DNA-directed RNA polymerase subunit M/transcription elongation factor TFIIS